MANALRNNKTLLSLDLKFNQIGTKGAEILRKAIDNNNTILYLDVNGNNISDDSFDKIEEKVKENRKRNPIPRNEVMGIMSTDDEEDLK